MRLRNERALLALALAAAVAQVGCSEKKDEAAIPVTTATMHSPEADANKPPEEAKPTSALATLSVASASSVSGDLRLEQRTDGVWIEGDVSGLSPGDHVVQIHEKGDCTAPDASTAGEPFVPESQANAASTGNASGEMANATPGRPATETAADANAPGSATPTATTATEPSAPAETQPPAANAPGAPAGDVRQAGNLGSIHADESGDATVALLAKDVTLADNNAILERSILIYDIPAETADESPVEAGVPVACGVIRSTAAKESQNPEQEQDPSFSMRSDRERTGTGATEEPQSP
jgi:Cu/Zn superoxide dismutase